MALIPENVQLIEIDVQSVENEESQLSSGAVDYYIDFENGRWTSQKITGQDKAMQWLKLGCLTEKYDYTINSEFGTPFERLIEEQHPREVIEGEILRGINELAEQHEDLTDITVAVDFKGNKAFVDIHVNGQAESVVRE